MTSTRAPGEWILAIRLRQLGDVLASLEVLRAIKQHRPDRKIALVVNAPYVALVQRASYIDRVMPPPAAGAAAWAGYLSSIHALHARAAIDLHGSARSAMITLVSGAPLRVGFDVRFRKLAYSVVEPRGEWSDGRRVPHNPITWGMRLARHVGAGEADSLAPALEPSDEENTTARGRMIAAGLSAGAIAAGRVVGLNPGRPVASKWWPSSRFVTLANRLRAAGREVIVFWGPGEEAEAGRIAGESGAVVAPQFSLVELPAALRACAALVTIDSGLKHLAVCARVPTVTVFGSTDPREWHMGGERDVALWRGLSCSPCRRLTCPFGAPCMEIDVDDALDAVMRVTEERA